MFRIKQKTKLLMKLIMVSWYSGSNINYLPSEQCWWLHWSLKKRTIFVVVVVVVDVVLVMDCEEIACLRSWVLLLYHFVKSWWFVLFILFYFIFSFFFFQFIFVVCLLSFLIYFGWDSCSTCFFVCRWQRKCKQRGNRLEQTIISKPTEDKTWKFPNTSPWPYLHIAASESKRKHQ